MTQSSPPSRDEILKAIHGANWGTLRTLTLRPGGLIYARREAWKYMLGVPENESASNSSDAPSKPAANAEDAESAEAEAEGEEPPVPSPHSDERQVHLDTERSFVLYPELSPVEKTRRKRQLDDLIVSVLRKRSKLGYFQGYHDIVSVILLTFDPEEDTRGGSGVITPDMQLLVERLSLRRLRDSMGDGLGPLIGQLRALRRLLRLAEPDIALSLERTSPLPYYALSNLLTLFSHDVSTLPLIQHIFDYLLTRPPVYSIYLAAAIIIARKADIEESEQLDEDGMIHALLTQIPDLSDDEPPPEDQNPHDPELDVTLSPGGDPSSPSIADRTLVGASISGEDEDDTVVENSEYESQTPPPPSYTSENGTASQEGPSRRNTQSSYSSNPLSKVNKGKDAIPLVSLLLKADELYEQFPPIATVPDSSSIPEVGDEKASLVSRSHPSLVSSGASIENSQLNEKDGGGLSTSPSQSKSSISLKSATTREAEDTPQPQLSLNVDNIFGPSSVLFTWSAPSSSFSSSNPPASQPSQPHQLTDDEAEQLLADNLPNVLISTYDGSSDHDFSEAEDPKEEYEDKKRSYEEEVRKRAREKKLEVVRARVGLGVAVLVGAGAVVAMLYAGGKGGDASVVELLVHQAGRGERTLGEWVGAGAWFVLGLGERVVGVL